jgi:hypothetical protein
MYGFRIWLATFLFSTAALADQWDANDPRLKIDPTTTDSYGAVSDYIQHAGIDKIAYTLEHNTESGRNGIAILVDQTVQNMVTSGINQLYSKGFKADADRLLSEYNQIVSGKIIDSWDVGDHQPWSQWLVKFYNELVALLGQQTVTFLHLDDLWELNYTVPVVFHPKDIRWDITEYRKHFVVLAGLVTYWVVDMACEAITYGSGWFLICTPIGDISEKVMVLYIAPGLSDRIYKKANNLN